MIHQRRRYDNKRVHWRMQEINDNPPYQTSRTKKKGGAKTAHLERSTQKKKKTKKKNNCTPPTAPLP
jgi:hypothetical protein